MRIRVFQTASAVAAAAALFGAAPAFADEVAFNVGVTSDYVFRGISQTDKDPAIQGGVDFSTDSGWYGGAWASNVDFGDSTDAEVDIYGGYTTEAGGFALDFGAIAYSYVGSPDGVSYDTFELKAAASRAFGPATLGAAVYWSPDSWGADGTQTYYEFNAAYTVTDKIEISGAIGRQTFDGDDDYTTWNVGGTYALTDKLGIDVRYHDTNISGLDERVNVSLVFGF